jgi:subtilisin-like proprotein convertase family protein
MLRAVTSAVESLERRTMLTVFSNPATISIPDSGTATPYPSTIAVSGLTDTVIDVDVTLKGVTHTWPDDIDVLLVSPGGQKSILMSDCGGSSPVSGINLTFNDEAASSLPDESTLTTGSWKPTDAGFTETFTAPAPAGPYTANLGNFDGVSGNGTWSLYVMDDASGDFGSISSGWELNITTGITTDFGDAPAPYPTLLASNGARHTINPSVRLGSAVDFDPDGQPSAGALLDDTTGAPDDEDGVVFTSALIGGTNASVDITASTSGFLNAWIDFNADGDWADAGEQIFTNTALVGGLNSKTFAVPNTPPDVTYARFRFSTAAGLSFTGAAADGEVEDYAFGKISGNKWNDLNSNGMKDAIEPGLAGWTVYADLNNNSSIDAGEPTTVTDASGNYTISGLPPRSYAIREVLQANWTQTVPGSTNFGTPLVNVAGQGYTSVHPPDTVGDIGLTQYVQAINSATGAKITIYNKSGVVTVPQFNLSSLAATATGGSPYNGFGDGVVIFDDIADRWLIMEFETTGNELDIFLSKTATASNNGADWIQYRVNATNFPDYPKITVWPDAYLIGTNEGDNPVYAINRVAMLSGSGGLLTPIRRTTTDRPNWPFNHTMPVDFDGNTLPPGGAPGIFIRQVDDELTNPGGANPSNDFLELWEFHPDFVTPASSTYVLAQSVPIADFSLVSTGLDDIPQPGTGVELDGLDDVFMWKPQYRNFGAYQTLVGNFMVDDASTGPGQAGVRWFELRKSGGAWSVYQQGTIAPDADFRWCGAIAMDGSGNIALGYNVSNSSTVFPTLRYIGRRATDPLGTMPRGEFTLINGASADPSGRWGDYAAMSVDPVDDSTFWFTGEYMPAGGNWSTRIAAFTLTPSVGPGPQNVILAQGAAVANVNFANHFNGNGYWDAGGDAVNWTDPLNWSNDVLPTSSDDVVIDVNGVANIVLGSGAQSIRSLLSQENLTISGGSLTIAQGATENLSLTVSGSGTAFVNGPILSAAQLTVSGNGDIEVLTGGTRVIRTGGLSITGNGTIDLADNDLIVDYSVTSPIGSWNGSTYTEITGYIRTGRNSGSWSGTALTTSTPTSSLTGLGVSEASGALLINGTETGVFAGQTVDTTTVLVKYTYGGDAKLDGKLNVDDYGRIDSNIGLGPLGWYNGDFNYDGKVNVDDYGIIDTNIGVQGPPLEPQPPAAPPTPAPADSETAAAASPPQLNRPVTAGTEQKHRRDDTAEVLFARTPII